MVYYLEINLLSGSLLIVFIHKKDLTKSLQGKGTYNLFLNSTPL